MVRLWVSIYRTLSSVNVISPHFFYAPMNLSEAPAGLSCVSRACCSSGGVLSMSSTCVRLCAMQKKKSKQNLFERATILEKVWIVLEGTLIWTPHHHLHTTPRHTMPLKIHQPYSSPHHTICNACRAVFAFRFMMMCQKE